MRNTIGATLMSELVRNASYIPVIVVLAIFIVHIVNVNILKRKKASCASWTIERLPGPKGLPVKLIGNLFQLPKPKAFIPKLFEWGDKYGPIFRFTVFNQDFVIISNAEFAQSVLQSNKLSHLTKTEVYHFLEGINGLAFTNGPAWRTMRKVTSQVFLYQNIDKQIAQFNKHGDNLLKLLYKQRDGDICAEENGPEKSTSSEHLIANCVVQMIIDTFITKPDSSAYSESLEYVKSWSRYTEITAHRIIHPWLGISLIWKWHPYHDELKQVMGNVARFADTLISRHIKGDDGKERQNGEEGSTEKNLISELLSLNYSRQQIHNEVVAMLFAHETNYLGLYYLLYMLAAHPEHQNKCREEVDQLYDSEDLESTHISLTHLSRLKHLERCFYEAMRLLPPVYVFGRKLETELKLADDQVLPAGTNCLIVPLVIHRRREYYENPTVFNPDRFLPENCVSRHAYAYLPFSGGPRVCLGKKSSIINVKIAAAKILRRFHISSAQKLEDLTFRVHLTTSTDQDLNLKFTPRWAPTA